MNGYLFYKALSTFSIVSLMVVNLLFAQNGSNVVSLWKNGAPGFGNKKNDQEQAKDWWVNHINNPSLTLFEAPKEIATGAAVVICPGGGFQHLAFNAEGRDAALYLNSIGVTAFVLKYRLFRQENSPYRQQHPMQDILRAMRLVRSMAGIYAIDTARIGVMGFSAGGEVAAWVANKYQDKNFIQPDAIDLLTSRPVFQMLIYPGPLAVPDSVSPLAPPAFLLAANNDECCSEPIVKLLQLHRKAKVAVEVHLISQGDHAFNMGKRSQLNSIKT